MYRLRKGNNVGLVVFNRYNNIGDALIAFSALEAGGLHPSWHNYYHGHNALMEIIALGGCIIQIPAQEFQEARLHIANLQTQEIDDFDPLPSTRLKFLKHSLLFLTTWQIYLFPFALLLQLPYKIAIGVVAAIVLGFSIWLGLTSEGFISVLALFGFGCAALILFSLILAYPLRTTLALIIMDIWLSLWLGFDINTVLSLLILFSYLLLNLHAYYIAVPKLQKRKSYVT